MAPKKTKQPTMLQRQRALRKQQQQTKQQASKQLPPKGGTSANTRQARVQRTSNAKAQAANQQRIIARGMEGFVRRGQAQDKLDTAARGTQGSGTRTAGAGGGLAKRQSSAVSTRQSGRPTTTGGRVQQSPSGSTSSNRVQQVRVRDLGTTRPNQMGGDGRLALPPSRSGGTSARTNGSGALVRTTTTAAAARPNALTRNLKFGRGNVAAMILGAANAADDSRLTPAQLRKKYEVVDPNRGQRIADNLLGLNQKPRPKQGNAQSRFAGARDANLNRINNDPRFAAPKAQGKPKAEKKPSRGSNPAPSMPRAVTASSPSRTSSSASPSTSSSSSSPVPTRKGSDQNKNRGSYASQFKEEVGRMIAASMVRQQNLGNMTSEDLKPKQNDNIKTKTDGTTTVYEPKTKIKTPDYSKKPIDQAKVEEYGRRKKRYYS